MISYVEPCVKKINIYIHAYIYIYTRIYTYNADAFESVPRTPIHLTAGAFVVVYKMHSLDRRCFCSCFQDAFTWPQVLWFCLRCIPLAAGAFVLV